VLLESLCLLLLMFMAVNGTALISEQTVTTSCIIVFLGINLRLGQLVGRHQLVGMASHLSFLLTSSGWVWVSLNLYEDS
jgi:hypothetical protein